jgi:hypothetical protein
MNVIQSVDQLIEVMRSPTGVTYRRRVGTGKDRHYENKIATRAVYLCQGGGWAVDYGGGELPETVLREAISAGILIDAFAGKFEGATPGVGYELAPHLKVD